MRRLMLTLSLLATLRPAPAAAADGAAARAAALFERAQRRMASGLFDERRIAIDEMERAVLLDPARADYELALARACISAGFLKQARRHFERVTDLAPRDAEARFGLGQVWRRDWLKYLEESSLDRAAENLSEAVRIDPKHCDAWLLLVPLLAEKHDLRSASAAAQRACEADPQRLEPRLAAAYIAYRQGRVARAESLFSATVPRLRRSLRARFDDIGPVASERDTATLHHLPEREQAEFVRRFWREHDPDLASPENEALLEYWARVAHAYFLFYDPRRREWDERGEVYVRYGPPSRATYNPVGLSQYLSFRTGPMYPMNVLVWNYPELGMAVMMQDRTLNEFYSLPVSMEEDMDPVPNPDSLAKLGDRLATRGGRGVFPVLPPEARSMPVDGSVARFESETGGRLLGQAGTAGSPGDTLTADWVVLDSLRNDVARGRLALQPSACDPADRQVADFAADLPPGPYLVGMTVRDPSGRRGVVRRTVRLGAPSPSLALSDVVVACGLPFIGPGAAPAVHLEPNPGARVEEGEALVAYFEVYHLRSGAEGRSRFEYVYTVRSAVRDPRVWLQRMFSPRREPAPISASREEENAGSLRRQYVSVPVQPLPPGRYRLEIKVRDLATGEEATGNAEFVREGAPEARGERVGSGENGAEGASAGGR